MTVSENFPGCAVNREQTRPLCPFLVNDSLMCECENGLNEIKETKKRICLHEIINTKYE